MLAVSSNVQPPAEASAGMRATGSRGKFVRDLEDRLIDVEGNPVQFVEKAKVVDIPAWDDLYRLPPDCVDAVHVMLSKGPDIGAWRQRQVRALRMIARRAHKLLDARLRAAVPSPASVHELNKDLNVGFLLVLIEALDYPDKRLPLLMLTGMKVVGDLAGQGSGVYRPVAPDEPMHEFRERWSAFEDSHDEWLCANERRTVDAVAGARFRASQGDRAELELLKAVHRATQVEVHKHLMGPAMDEEQLRSAYEREGRLTCRVIPRFGVVQGSTRKRCRACDVLSGPCSSCEGQTMPKMRCCDDARRSGTNEHTRSCETVFYPSPEFPARVAAQVFDWCERHAVSRPGLLLGCDDLFAAYRRVPCSQPRFTVVSVYDFDEGAVRYHDVFGMNFGLQSAPVQFCRVPEMITCAARCFLAVATDHYCDDYMTVDVAGFPIQDSDGVWPSSAQWALNQLHDMIGFRLEPQKRKHGAAVNEALGVVCDFSGFTDLGCVELRPTEKRRAEIIQSMRAAQARGRLLPHEAQVLLGRLNWVLSSSYASVGRAATLPLVDRATRSGATVWTPALSHMVDFFTQLFQDMPPLRFDFGQAKRKKVIVFTDASFKHSRAGLGVMLFDQESDEQFVCSKRVPDWVLRSLEDRETQINHLEMLGILCAVETFGESHLQGRDVLFFCDNTCALSGAVHGYARSTDMAALSNALHLQLARLRCRTWFEWVPSKANPADVPSRVFGPTSFYDEVGVTQWAPGLCLPARDVLSSHSLDWLFPDR